MRIPTLATVVVVLATTRSVCANNAPTAAKIGAGIQTKSDGVYVLDTGARGGHLLVEQSWDGDARLWRYTGSTWKAEQLYTGLGQCFSPLVADFDGKSNYVIYLGSWDKRAGIHQIPLSKQFKPSKDITTIPGSAACGSILCLRAGDGRGDGVMRLYVGSEGPGGGLYEFTKRKNSTQWSSAKIHTGGVGEFAIGAGRGDTIQRIYAGDRGSQGTVYEFTWKSGAWEKHAIQPHLKDIRTVALGDGRGDGIQRLYVNAGKDCWEVSYTTNTWQARKVGRTGSRYYIVPIGSKSGARVYSSVQGVGLFEWLWRGGAYHERQVDAVTAATGGIAVGDGRGDGVRRLYITNGDRQQTGAVVWELPLP